MSEESELQKLVVPYLRAALRPLKAHVMVIAGNKHCRSIPGWQPGNPDIAVILPGRIVGIELKTRRGVVDPDQLRRHAEWREAGAEVHVCRSFEAVEALVRDLHFKRAA